MSVVLAPRIAAAAVQAGLEALASDAAAAAARALEQRRLGREPGAGAAVDGGALNGGMDVDGAAEPAAPGTPPDPARPVTAEQTRAAAAVALAAAAERAKLMAEEQEAEMERAARRVLKAQLARVKVKTRYLEMVDQARPGGGGGEGGRGRARRARATG